MKRKMSIIAAIALLAAVAVACVPAMLRRDVFPRDPESAKRALRQVLKRQRPRVQDNQIELVSTTDTWLAHGLPVWVFGTLRPLRALVGGPRYERVYLVGPAAVPKRDPGVESRNVTTDFRSAFEWMVRLRPPATEAEALDIAKSYASLATQTRPERLKVLGKADDAAEIFRYLSQSNPQLAESFRSQIAAPHVHVNRVAPRNTAIFTVEFCTQSLDFWGAIYFWHMEIGKHVFSVSRRPVYWGFGVLA